MWLWHVLCHQAISSAVLSTKLEGRAVVTRHQQALTTQHLPGWCQRLARGQKHVRAQNSAAALCIQPVAQCQTGRGSEFFGEDKDNGSLGAGKQRALQLPASWFKNCQD